MLKTHDGQSQEHWAGGARKLMRTRATTALERELGSWIPVWPSPKRTALLPMIRSREMISAIRTWTFGRGLQYEVMNGTLGNGKRKTAEECTMKHIRGFWAADYYAAAPPMRCGVEIDSLSLRLGEPRRPMKALHPCAVSSKCSIDQDVLIYRGEQPVKRPST
jgi:hypothetical protein